MLYTLYFSSVNRLGYVRTEVLYNIGEDDILDTVNNYLYNFDIPEVVIVTVLHEGNFIEQGCYVPQYGVVERVDDAN